MSSIFLPFNKTRSTHQYQAIINTDEEENITTNAIATNNIKWHDHKSIKYLFVLLISLLTMSLYFVYYHSSSYTPLYTSPQLPQIQQRQHALVIGSDKLIVNIKLEYDKYLTVKDNGEVFISDFPWARGSLFELSTNDHSQIYIKSLVTNQYLKRDRYTEIVVSKSQLFDYFYDTKIYLELIPSTTDIYTANYMLQPFATPSSGHQADTESEHEAQLYARILSGGHSQSTITLEVPMKPKGVNIGQCI